MQNKVLSLDIATNTGFSFANLENKTFSYGLIKLKPKLSRAEKLKQFRLELINLLSKFNPTDVVMEDIYSGPSPKVLVFLAKLAGVAEECCLSVSSVEPYLIHTSTVKAYMKQKTKQDIFEAIKSLINEETFTFKKHNDITDSICQLMAYSDLILEAGEFRQETDYGYIYTMKMENIEDGKKH